MLGANSVANGENGIETIVIEGTGHLAATFDLNYSEIPNSWLWKKLAFRINIRQVLADGRKRYLIQLRDEPLRQPHGVAIEAHLDVQSAVFVNK